MRQPAVNGGGLGVNKPRRANAAGLAAGLHWPELQQAVAVQGAAHISSTIKVWLNPFSLSEQLVNRTLESPETELI